MAVNTIGILIGIVWLLVQLAIIGAIIYLFVLIVKALKKYIGSKEVREEKRRGAAGACGERGRLIALAFGDGRTLFRGAKYGADSW